MGRGRALVAWITAAALAVMAAGIFALAGGFAADEIVFRRDADRIEAEIVAERVSRSTGRYSLPTTIWRVRLPDGSTAEIEAGGPADGPGDRVAVLVDPAQPSDVRNAAALTRWQGPAIFAGIGAALLALALALAAIIEARRMAARLSRP